MRSHLWDQTWRREDPHQNVATVPTDLVDELATLTGSILAYFRMTADLLDHQPELARSLQGVDATLVMVVSETINLLSYSTCPTGRRSSS